MAISLLRSLFKMRLNGLEPLYRSMRYQGIDRYRFRYRCNNVEFDIFFLIDETPFQLLFGVLIKNFSFILPVERGFCINPKLDPEDFSGLCKVLGLRPNPENRFSTRAFFEEFNQCIPAQADRRNVFEPHEIAPYYPKVEEADKKYFWGWRHNDVLKERVSSENLEKTRRILGYQAYEICKARNISSRWTNRREDAKEFNLQDLREGRDY